ncbi:CHAD domain-containing protein [Streptomyces sp. NPDC046866]|uniref:CHAD domain-containing protein n=1 Tax=Streptomyces sp. NPDC046866 TaxID=3154921 RepID=UPI00345367EA
MGTLIGVEAATAVGAYVQRERDRLVSREPLVRRDRPGAVKAMRTASRRLRSVWHTLDATGEGREPEPREPDRPGPGAEPGSLPGEFTWLNARLGVVRHLDETAHRVASHPVMRGRPAHWTVQRIERLRGPARCELLLVLDGPRYGSLVAALDEKADAPVPADAATRLHGWFCAAWLPLLDAFAAASAVTDPEARADELHEVRKAAKPVLDTGRSVARAHPDLLRRPLRGLGALHDLLGEHQDSTVCRRTLEDWPAEAPDREVRDALRRLTECERSAAASVEARLAALHRELTALRPGG